MASSCTVTNYCNSNALTPWPSSRNWVNAYFECILFPVCAAPHGGLLAWDVTCNFLNNWVVTSSHRMQLECHVGIFFLHSFEIIDLN